MPEKKVVVPEESQGFHSDDPSSKKYSHPAFGQISVSRISATPGQVLYGSDFKHGHFLSLRISHSELNRDLSRDWHFARNQIVEVWMSEAQWAAFVSSPNQGDGVPCTLQRVQGEEMPGIPLRIIESVFKQEVKQTVQDAVDAVDKAMAELETILGAAVSKKKKEEIMGLLERTKRELDANLPFVEKSFGKHIEGTMSRARIEVDAYVTAAIVRAGVKALGGEPDAPLQLGPGEDHGKE